MHPLDYLLWKYTGCTLQRRRLSNWMHFNVNIEVQHMIARKLQTETMRRNTQRLRNRTTDVKPAS